MAKRTNTVSVQRTERVASPEGQVRRSVARSYAGGCDGCDDLDRHCHRGSVAGHQSDNHSSSDTPTPPPPITASALQGLLLSPDQVSVAIGTTGLKLTGTWSEMADRAANLPNTECLAIDGPGEKAKAALEQ
jgi:hypothetical protein